MSETDGRRGPARPRQVTVAGVMAAAACLLLVFTLFDAMAQVRSADMRDTVDAFLRKPPGNGLGLDAAAVVDLLRGLVLFSGALAAAGAVLAIFALQRHRGARIGLSVAAVLLLFSATFVAGFLPVVIAVATTMLWRQEARDWFDGREPQPRPARATSPSAGPTPPGLAAWQPPSGSGAGASDDKPAPATYPLGTWPAQGQPGGYPSAPLGQPSRRPTSVTVAAWLTWVSAGIIAFVFLLVVLTLLVQRDQLLAELHKNAQFADLGLTNQQVLGIFWVTSAVCVFWAFSAMALAVLAFRRVNLGRIGLAISAGLAGAVCLFAVPFGWPHAVAAFATVVLLFRGGANQWYAGRDVPPGPPQPPTQFQAPPQPPAPEGKPPVW